jgi:thiamine biosynthesis lipoprotein
MSPDCVFEHHAMATHWVARIATPDHALAEGAAQAVFDEIDALERRLSRFRPDSEVAEIAGLAPGESTRLSPSTASILALANELTLATGGAFSPLPHGVPPGSGPAWELALTDFTCIRGPLHFDLGALGKGHALDCAAAILREWDLPAFLLVAGWSSLLAGDAPPGFPGWVVHLDAGAHAAPVQLESAAVGASGLLVHGAHILDPRSGLPATSRHRTWAFATSAARADAWSTAAFVLGDLELAQYLDNEQDVSAALQDAPDTALRRFGRLPPGVEFLAES